MTNETAAYWNSKLSEDGVWRRDSKQKYGKSVILKKYRPHWTSPFKKSFYKAKPNLLQVFFKCKNSVSIRYDCT